MSTIAKKSLIGFGYTLEANYYLALVVSLVVAVLSLIGDQSLFYSGNDNNNPVINNLKLLMVYLALAELSVFVYCTLRHSYRELIMVGLFLILLIGALEFYGQVNQLVVNQVFYLFFLYTGLSHLLYGILATAGKGGK